MAWRNDNGQVLGPHLDKDIKGYAISKAPARILAKYAEVNNLNALFLFICHDPDITDDELAVCYGWESFEHYVAFWNHIYMTLYGETYPNEYYSLKRQKEAINH